MKKVVLVFFVFLVDSCATYYQVNTELNSLVESGNLEKAYDYLLSRDQLSHGKDRFLYYLNAGSISSIIGRYEESNEFLEKAYIYGEDYVKNPGQRIASFLINQSVIDYPGEDHEHLLLLYYKALNYLKLGDTEKALIECRRLNIRLQQLSDRFKSEEKYRRDAFIHNLMGIIYDADRDYNNAFIAYRNAYEIYRDDYSDMFQIEAPEQLKMDLIRTAYLTGFYDEGRKYEELFDLKYKREEPGNGTLIFFWHNGLGPVKDEWSINFGLVEGKGGMVLFENDEYGFSFPFFIPDYGDPATLKDVHFIRVAFPKYRERPEMFDRASLIINEEQFPLYKVEDITAVAKKVLTDRMLLEFSNSLIRVALKKGAEYAARNEENYGLATALNIYSALTEKADTRNWQTLPNTIYYQRINLPPGTYQADFEIASQLDPQYDQTHRFTYVFEQGKTKFHTFNSLEISPEFRYNPYYQ
jgi:hypothetical protein